MTLLWGYKFVAVDLTTDDHQGGRYRWRPGEWHTADPGDRQFTTSDPCPQFPGDGLCVARTLPGAQSGGARLGSSVMLLVGYRPRDVLCEQRDKLRVTGCWVYPDPIDPVRAIIGPGADLVGADLRGADLRGADLRGADLVGADLGGADLRGAYLGGADLRGADLRGADLRGADLVGADLGGANLRGANRPSWLPAEWTVTPHGYITEATS